eukprot:TRINITY_DN10420_c0_g1_i1.p1 TRINITY_DN10420_c0_g1~~TRINITY_DN10420_c0_g1_i1.p1  ORF type:complete len:354 (+),score=-0.51 TRINITY_DN10420_c0_g1_i1:38-1099(+)
MSPSLSLQASLPASAALQSPSKGSVSHASTVFLFSLPYRSSLASHQPSPFATTRAARPVDSVKSSGRVRRSARVMAESGGSGDATGGSSGDGGFFDRDVHLLLVSDLDNTMVDHKDGNHTALREFGSLWQSAFSSNSLLVYSTGRSPTLYLELKSQVPLLTPDMVICSVGTEIKYGADMRADGGWEAYLDEGWDRQAVVEEAKQFSQLRFQTDSEQRPHKVSFHLDKADAGAVVEPLRAKLRARGLPAKLIYSGGYDLDILPERAGKGQALAYLLRRFTEAGKPPRHTLACGDSGNDAELFEVQGAYGVIVGNAMEELVAWYDAHKDTRHVFRATQRCAGGIVQAIEHFKLKP